MKVLVGVLTIGLLGPAAFAETQAGASTWNGLSDRFQIDSGYFRLKGETMLRLNSSNGQGGEVNFEKDLDVPEQTNTFWVDSTWRVGRRHQLKLSFTRQSRERGEHTLSREFTWGGETYSAGLQATSTTGSDMLGGYYRFALVRNDRFEIGPSVGIGYLWLNAGIQASGTVSGPGGTQTQKLLDKSGKIDSITGAVGGYTSVWPAKRLQLQGDFLYIKVKPGDTEASVTDWRGALDWYFSRHVGLGVQYKYYRYTYDRGILSSKLGGQLTFQGGQAFLSFLF